MPFPRNRIYFPYFPDFPEQRDQKKVVLSRSRQRARERRPLYTSSLHGTILILFYVLFVQWSGFPLVLFQPGLASWPGLSHAWYSNGYCNAQIISGFFGPGQLENLKETIEGLEKPAAADWNAKNSDMSRPKRSVFVSAIFVSTYKLTSKQRKMMEEVLQKPVLDRYNVVLQIFKRHARTKEAKMQVHSTLDVVRSK